MNRRGFFKLLSVLGLAPFLPKPVKTFMAVDPSRRPMDLHVVKLSNGSTMHFKRYDAGNPVDVTQVLLKHRVRIPGRAKGRLVGIGP